MELSRKHDLFLKIICLAILSGFAICLIGIPVVKSAVRKHQLEQLPYYIIYDDFGRYQRGTYDIYLMINEEQNDLSDADIIKNLVTDDFVSKMREVPKTNPLDGNLYEIYGKNDIWVHVLFPTDDLPYGWEKSYEYIAYDVPFSIISDAKKAIIIIPVDAAKASECELIME